MRYTRRPTPPKRPTTPEASGTPDPTMLSDVTTLQAQLRLSRAQCAYLHRELTALKQTTLAQTSVDDDAEALRAAYTALREQHAILARHYADLQKRYDQLAHDSNRRHKEITEFWEAFRGGKGSPTQSSLVNESVDLTAMVTKLLILAHPDKWSQGQLATALAHEITVQLNQLRIRLEGQL